MSESAENVAKVKLWIEDFLLECNDTEDVDAFDLAVDCAYALDLCEMCEINGDKTFIPEYIVEIATNMLYGSDEL